MTAGAPGEPSAAAPLLDVRSLVVAVRRRRRLWSSAALLGLLGGGAVAVVLPQPPTATTKVLVARQEDQPNDPGTLIRTDVALLGTTRIADAALRSLGSGERPEDFIREYEGVGLTNNVLQIQVTGGSEAEAVARARALADAFVADHVRRIREAADAEARTLLDQRDRLRGDLAEVNKAIGEGPSGDGSKASADTESLFSRRAELTSQIADFGQRAAEARIGTPRLVAGTQIVDAPRMVPYSLPRVAATDGAIGLALGLVVGLAVSSVGSVVADRPILRGEIAANLGASVVAELPRRPGGLLRRRRRVRAARERLTASLVRAVRGPSEPVSLLELGCARGASVIALDLARALAAEGPVVVVDGLPGPWLAERRAEPGDPVVVRGDQAGADSGRERRLGVGSVAPGTAWTDLRYLGTRTVLVVRAGHGSAAWLHTVARQLAEQHIAVIGVVLIDPDPRDRTDGTLWDGPETARRGGSEGHARQNGTGRQRTERLPLWAARVPDSDQEAR
ncbi:MULTISPECIES: Wzz/FepE/Etk N-terminal domain-containing protein [unclassified Streptomyces]|uniref:Wzz/FepE/Etk N-terminal domain-containing protein n=1 Tax=unclassified Streptomyces TaxID=2593676 RepID=UPI0016612DCC|nr:MULTISPECIES: Wzz/FepE/Etk N-terminal domain-containing protein [unclassified Streptomyces]MBD0711183.1 polysaccharide biosynthesis protein [Streptomyces sp. CBMA291]MBD0714214.1 polysaccharide biosynthesis protein [Streptomyces sp. CBMA370]